jgi:hypothetical protein
VNTSHAKALRLANNSVQRHALLLQTVLRTSSWTTISITSVTASTTFLKPNRLRAVVVVRVLRHKAPQLVQVQVLRAPAAASLRVVKVAHAAATALPPARRRPSVAAHATVLHVTARPVAKSPATVARLAPTTSRVRNRPCKTRAARHRRSSIKSRKPIGSRLLSNWINCQAVRAARNQRC